MVLKRASKPNNYIARNLLLYIVAEVAEVVEVVEVVELAAD